jgi:uncharacterized protein
MPTHHIKIRIFFTGLIICFLVGATRHEKISNVSEEDTMSFPIIDAHTHTRFSGERERSSHILMTAEEYLSQMKEAGIAYAISHTGQNGEGYSKDLRSKGVTFCAGIGTEVDTAKLDADLKSGKFKCIKIYLGYVHQFASDPHYRPAYLLAEKYDVPVVFHTGDTYSIKGKIKYADPLTIDEVAVDYPKVRFVIAHLGNPWIESAAEVAYKNPNVWLEGSALLIGDMSKLPIEQVEEYLIRPLRWTMGYVENPKKLIFGTDWPLNEMKPYLEAFKKAIPKEYWKAVFHDNAVEVFNLKVD